MNAQCVTGAFLVLNVVSTGQRRDAMATKYVIVADCPAVARHR